ncbi:MAG TPA: hypothetical protein PLM09_16405 [Casimicrobiaceae bacterium]|nr:hypothetical protein [Casimicrobiaceae bacterium]
MTDAAEWLDHAVAFWRRVGGFGPAVAVILLAGILAGVGGFMSWRYRVYGALMGGMLANAFAKAGGATFEAAFVAMLFVTAAGVALGSAGMLTRLVGRIARR